MDALKHALWTSPFEKPKNTKLETDNGQVEIKKQLDRIETKLDKLLGPQLINGIWR